MDKVQKTLLASLKKIRDNQDGTEDWMVETPFEVINYGFIKTLERKVKGLEFESVKVVNGKLTLYFIRKGWTYAHEAIKKCKQW